MAARPGLAWIIAEWRRLVSDPGTAVWTDDEAQALLERHQEVHVHTPLIPMPQPEGGSTVWKVYVLPGPYWEEPTSGTQWFRITDANGSVIPSSAYTLDAREGVVTFNQDQQGKDLYVTGRRYDFFSAAGDAWLEAAATKADLYDFKADGGTFSRSQWFKHCQSMAEWCYRQAPPKLARVMRADVWDDGVDL